MKTLKKVCAIAAILLVVLAACIVVLVDHFPPHESSRHRLGPFEPGKQNVECFLAQGQEAYFCIGWDGSNFPEKARVRLLDEENRVLHMWDFSTSEFEVPSAGNWFSEVENYIELPFNMRTGTQKLELEVDHRYCLEVFVEGGEIEGLVIFIKTNY